MVRPDGSDLQMLHESVFLYQEIGWSQVVNHAPAWSPDSKWLAFVTRNGSERSSPNESNITILNVETGEWQFVGAGNGTSISPSWSPDGKKLIFASNRDFRNFYIYRLDLDENTVVNLTPTDENFDLSPTWSLSGAHIAYLHWNELVIMDADGTNKVIIGEEGMGIVRGIPAWLPNP